MNHFLYFQIFPLLFLFLVLTRLERSVFIQRFGILLLFIFGFSLQFLFWYLSHPNLENPDSMGFYRLAHGLEIDLRNILFRPKLYPIFLGLFPTLKLTTFFQVILKTGIGYFILRLSKIFAWKLGTTLFILTLYFINSLWLQEPLRVMDSTLFTFLWTASFWLFIECLYQFSTRHFFSLCICMGLASLTRQVGDLSFFVMSIVLIIHLVQKKEFQHLQFFRLRFLFPLSLGILIAFSGLLWNGLNYGIYKRTVAVAVSLYTHSSYYQLANNLDEEWKYVEKYLPDAQANLGSWKTNYRFDIPWAVNALPHDLERALLKTGDMGIVETDEGIQARFLNWVRNNPKKYAASVGNELMRLLWKCEEYYPESILEKGFNRFSIKTPVFMVRFERGIIHLSIGFLVGIAIFGFFLDKRRRHLLLLPLLGIGIYLILIPSVQLGFTRYGFPVIPILLILFGHTCDQIRNKFVRSAS